MIYIYIYRQALADRSAGQIPLPSQKESRKSHVPPNQKQKLITTPFPYAFLCLNLTEASGNCFFTNKHHANHACPIVQPASDLEVLSIYSTCMGVHRTQTSAKAA